MATQYEVDLLFRAPKTQALDQLTRQLAEMDRKARSIGGADPFKGIESSAKGATGAVRGLDIASKGLLATFGPLLAAFSVLGSAKFIFDKTAEIEKQTKSLEVLTGSLTKTKDIIAELQAFGAVTPFTSSELIDTAKRLTAFGISAERVVDVTKRLGDVSGATGAELAGIVTAYGQVVAKGRLQGEELLQFQERGVDVLGELRRMYGLTGEEMQDALSKGKVSSEALEVAIERLTEKGGKYADGAISQSTTLSGKLSTLQDNIEGIARKIGEVLTPAIKQVLDAAIQATNAISSLLDQQNNQSRELEYGRRADAFVQKQFGPLGALTSGGEMAAERQRAIEVMRAGDARLRAQERPQPAPAPRSAVPALLGGTGGGGGGGGGSGGRGGGKAGGLSFRGGTQNERLVFDELVRRGYNKPQIAAVMGSLAQESSFNPYAREPSPGTGLGLFQWSFDRRNKVPGFTGNVGTDISRQLDLFERELSGPEAKAGRTLRGATTLDQAALGMKQFERYGIAGNRYKYMDEYMGRIGGSYAGKGAGSSGSSIAGVDDEASRQAKLNDLKANITYGKEALSIQERLNTAKAADDKLGEALAQNQLELLQYKKEYDDIVRNTSDPEERRLKLQEKELELVQLNRDNVLELAQVQEESAKRLNDLMVEKAKLAEGAIRPIQEEIDLMQAQIDGTEIILAAKRELAALTSAGVSSEAAQGLIGKRDALKAQQQTPGYLLGQDIKQRQTDLDALMNPANQLITAADSIGDAFGQAFQDIASGSMTAGEALSQMFGNIASSFLKMATDMLAQQAALSILKLFMGGGGGAGAGAGGSGFLTGGLFDTAFSFAGGGFTGNGPRSGGVDGQGGFPAILHPRESVIDHYEASRAALADSGSALQGGGSSPDALFADTRRAIGGSVAGGTVSTSTAMSQNQTVLTNSNQILRERMVEQQNAAAAQQRSEPIDVRIDAYDPAGAGLATLAQVQAVASSTSQRTQQEMLRRMRNDPSFRRGQGL